MRSPLTYLSSKSSQDLSYMIYVRGVYAWSQKRLWNIFQTTTEIRENWAEVQGQD